MDLMKALTSQYMKQELPEVQVGDTVRVHQKIKEGNKERVQIFEGVVIRTDNKTSHTSRITVRKIASGVGVEKSFMLHNPLIEKVEVTRRAKVRRNYLSFLRNRSGKSARLKAVQFDREGVNTLKEAPTTEGSAEEVATEAK